MSEEKTVRDETDCDDEMFDCGETIVSRRKFRLEFDEWKKRKF